ncbi:MAG: hypothetical protein QF685_09245 [Verrucomicrobiota bacterium]|nr:hypothetical protein [Verrucomicrobiota bacterium]
MKRALVLLAVCAFAVSPFGFVGCSSGVPEDPDAAANEAKQKELAPDPGDPDDALKGTTDPSGKFGFGEEEKKD